MENFSSKSDRLVEVLTIEQLSEPIGTSSAKNQIGVRFPQSMHYEKERL